MKYSLEFEHSGSEVCLLSKPCSTSCLTSESTLSVNLKSALSLIFTICKSGCCCSVAKPYPTLCDPRDCSKTGSSVLHYLPKFAQIHIHWSQWCNLTISSSVTPFSLGLPRWCIGKKSDCQSRKRKRLGFDSWLRKIPWRRATWQPTPVFLPGKSHAKRSLEVYSPCGCKESDMTEHAHSCTVKVEKVIIPASWDCWED